MGLLDKTFIITNDEYKQGVGLDCYDDRYSLKSGKRGDSKIFIKWVFPQKWDNSTREGYAGDKAFPMSIELPGNPETAAMVLIQWAIVLADEEGLDIKSIAERALTNPMSRKRQARRPAGVDTSAVPDDEIPF